MTPPEAQRPDDDVEGPAALTCSSWFQALEAERPGDALPTRGLTILQMGATSDLGGHWPTAVLTVASDVTGTARPLMYVASGGLSLSGNVPPVVAACAGSPLLATHLDEDVVVATPPTLQPLAGRRGRGRAALEVQSYRCFVPTLQTIAPALEAHEREHGPTTVIFDEAQALRPYWYAEPGEDLSGMINMTHEQVHGWRSTDVLSFAEKRSAPTVVLWDYPVSEAAGLSALVSVALMHITVEWPPESQVVDVTVARRAGLTEPWPTGRTMSVPRYERTDR